MGHRTCGAEMRSADMRRTHMGRADVGRTHMGRTDMSGAEMRSARVRSTEMRCRVPTASGGMAPASGRVTTAPCGLGGKARRGG